MQKVLFTAGLSNGETITEEHGDFCRIDGALSPWQRLLSYVATKGIYITSLSLLTADGQRWNLPSAGKNPKFKEFGYTQKPVSFRMFRKIAKEGNTIQDLNAAPSSDMHTCIEAVYEDGGRIQVWVREDNRASWTVRYTAEEWKAYEDSLSKR
jgi:hypothetical protein